MKKILAFIVCIAMCFGVCSCARRSALVEEEVLPNHASNEENTDGGQQGGGGKRPSAQDTVRSENELAEEAFKAVLRNERALIYPLYSGEMTERYFSDLIWINHDGIPLQAFVDMDQDGVDELLIRHDYGGETALLHYENGMVYGYDFSNASMMTVYDDGSFGWDCYDDRLGWESGISKISFVEGRLKFFELARQEEYVNFYLNGVAVTEAEYREYVQGKELIKASFFALDLQLLKEGDALAIASSYWGIEQGEFHPQTGYRYRLSVKREGDLYRVCLYWLVQNCYYEHLGCLWVDLETGEITIPPDQDGKG